VSPSSPNHPSTVLAHGQFNLSDTITVELVQPANEPPRILIVWPPYRSVTTAAKYAEVAAAAMRVLANGVTELSRLKVNKRGNQ
jgi:hypothetical protein